MSSFWQFFDSQMAIFQRVSYICTKYLDIAIKIEVTGGILWLYLDNFRIKKEADETDISFLKS